MIFFYRGFISYFNVKYYISDVSLVLYIQVGPVDGPLSTYMSSKLTTESPVFKYPNYGGGRGDYSYFIIQKQCDLPSRVHKGKC